MSVSSTVITRFPPSPTGFLHIGSVRTALFNYLFAAHHGGTMYLRFEDTDKERSKKEYEDDILAGLAWLQMPHASPAVTRQSERTDIYRAHLKKLIDARYAYEAEEGSDDAEKKVVRFKNPNTRITFTDLIRGEVSFDTSELKDFVIAKSIDEPLYHLAVVIDDAQMGVTHVIRGEDHISNTPRQILILEALGFTRPHYAHIPLILAPDRSKLSKRHGAVSVNEYRAQGFLPEALINYLALLGWNPGGDQEIFSLEELVNNFSIERIHKGGAIFNIEKLRWYNKEYLRKMSDDDFADYALTVLYEALATRNIIASDDVTHLILPIIREHISASDDIRDMVGAGEFDYYFKSPELDPARLPYKDESPDEALQHIENVRQLLEVLGEDEFSDAVRIKDALWEYADGHGRGNVLWPLRYALTGVERSPDPFVVASIIGKSETLQRIETATEMLRHK